MNTGTPNTRSLLLLSALTLTLAACASERQEPAPVVYRTEAPAAPAQRPAPEPSSVAPSAAPSPIPSGQADSRGVVHYDGYETIRARDNDTVDSMAARVGITGSELAAYNGLSTQYAPREGDELVIPARASGSGGGSGSAGGPAGGGVTQTALDPAVPSEYRPSAPERMAEAGATAAPAAETGGNQEWSADLAREAIGESPPQSGGAETARTETAAVEPPAPPPAPASSGSNGFSRPVDAAVSRPFSRSPGPDRNDGVDFATQAGDSVRAAASGTVALISESLGGLGTIVLIRHDNEYLTVYGRVDGVTVAKGDRVERGQVIAKVADLAPPQSPSLHYEVRRGAESIDPSPYL